MAFIKDQQIKFTRGNIINFSSSIASVLPNGVYFIEHPSGFKFNATVCLQFSIDPGKRYIPVKENELSI
jgi:hypothetical protein